MTEETKEEPKTLQYYHIHTGVVYSVKQVGNTPGGETLLFLQSGPSEGFIILKRIFDVMYKELK